MAELRTRRIDRPGGGSGGLEAFLAAHRAALVLLSGPAAGREYELEVARVWIGRGPDADLLIDDPSMSRAHAAIEFADSGFRVRDMGSTNGVRLNESPVQTAELKHGDRIQLGESVLQFIVERRTAGPPTYVLPDD